VKLEQIEADSNQFIKDYLLNKIDSSKNGSKASFVSETGTNNINVIQTDPLEYIGTPFALKKNTKESPELDNYHLTDNNINNNNYDKYNEKPNSR